MNFIRMRRVVIIILTFLMVFVCHGFCGCTKSLYLVPITEALDIPRSVFSLTESFQYVTTAVVNLFFGTLINRFGTKKLISAGFLSLITSMLCFANANTVWGFYIGSIFLGMGLSWTTTTMVGCIVNKWCQEKQGAIMGAILGANGAGVAFATQIVSPIIYQEDKTLGYRDSYKLMVLMLVILGTLFMLLYKEKVSEQSYKPSEKTQKYGGDKEVYKVIIRTPYFYLTIVCIFFTGGILQGIYGVFPAYMKDTGLDPAYVALVVSINSLALAVAKFMTGLLYDKCGLRFVANSCYIAAVVSILVLVFLANTGIGMALAVIYAVVFSFSLPLQTVMLPFFSKDLFNPRAYNLTLGLFVSISSVGFACSGPVMNCVFDVCGSYKPALIVCGFIMASMILGLQYVIKVSKQKQR